MLRILKSNPIVLLVLSILMSIAVWVWVGLSPLKHSFYSGNMPIFNLFFGWVNKSPILALVFGLILLLLEAFTWNSFINSNSLLKQSTYFPAFFFILLASCRASLICLFPSMLASLFLILAMRRMAESYKKEKALSEVFDAGLFIGIASLFYVPAAVYMLFLWIAILIIRSLIWREWVVAVIGFILPFVFALAYHIIFFTPEKFWYEKLLMTFSNYRTHWSFTWQEWLLIIAVFCSCVAGTWFYLNKIADNVVKAQKIWMLMLWFVFFAAVSVFISAERDARSLFIMIPPFSFIFSNYFLKAKSTVWPEFLFLCLLSTVIVSIVF